MVSLWLGLLIIVLCLATSAFLSFTETTVTSISNLKAKHMKENGGASSKVLELWLHSPHKVLAALLIGNNLVNIFASILMDDIMRAEFGESSVLVVTAIMTFSIVLFAEIIPKTIAKNYSQILIVPVLNIFQFFYWILYPFTIVMSTLSNLITSVTVKKPDKNHPQITEEELEFLIDVGEEEGVIEEKKHGMLSGIFELGDTVVREIMVHRIDMTAIPASTKVLDSIDFFKETGLSRIPVFEERIDNVVGFLHVKDVLFFLKKHRDDQVIADTTVGEIKREALFVHENKPLDQLFQEILKNRQHMAIVLDEYGGTSGIVTMEDIFEEIFGEVRDEFDNEEDAIRPTQVPNQYLVECKIHIDDFCDFFDISIEASEQGIEAHEFDTLAGLILHHFGQIPKYGDKMTLGRVELEIVEVSKRRVRRVLAKVLSEERKASRENMLLQDEDGLPIQQSS